MMYSNQKLAGLVAQTDEGGEPFFVVATSAGVEYLMPVPCTLLPEDTAEWSSDATFRIQTEPDSRYATFIAVVRY